jgi:hypothetical protein
MGKHCSKGAAEMTMTPDQIASAWALVNAATEGPWDAKPSPFEVYNIGHGALPNHIVSGYTMIAALYSDDLADPDARFIVASRELVPQLLTALDAERAEIARLTRINADHCRSVNTLLLSETRMEDRAKKAETENARLVEGLEAIAKTEVFSMGIGIDARPTHEANMARAALALIKGGA